jgi:DNA-binding PadR family transcriptional regulator
MAIDMAQTKNLGSLQEKVLFFLAENPDNHTQGIQKGIEHKSEQYGSVLKAVKTLQRLGYIESQKGTSKKKVTINLYSCTEKGVLYALTRNSSADFGRIFNAYKEKHPDLASLRSAYDTWGHDNFAMFIKDVGIFLPMIEKDGIEKSLPFMMLQTQRELRELGSEKRNRFMKDLIKHSPIAKKSVKELKKRINELLEEE